MKKLFFMPVIILMISLLLDCGGGGSNSAESPRFNGDNNEIKAFSFSGKKNTSLGLKTDVTGQITDNTISLQVPYGVSVASLVAEFVSNSSIVKVNGNGQVSGVTPNDFSGPVTYSVFADDSTKHDYTVTVTKALNSEKKINSFSIAGIAGTIDEGTGSIIVILPPLSGANPAVASFTYIGKSIAVNSVLQQSGVTSNDFTNQVVYAVSADDGSNRTYTVSVTVEKDTRKDLTGFKFLKDKNPDIQGESDISGVINDTDISVILPFESDKNNLIATFETNGIGTSVKVSNSEQQSGITPNDFTDSVIYTVIAEDGSTKDYSVAVTVAKSDAKAITSFSLDGETCTIDEQNSTITVQFQASKNLSNLVADFVSSGVSVKVNDEMQISGETANNYTNPITFTVTADNGTTRNYTITAVVSAEITGLWNFEYGAGSNSTVSGTTEVQGLTGNALQFNGSTDYITTPDDPGLTLADGGSIEVVLYAITHRPFAGIVHKGVRSDFSDETYSFQFWGAGGVDGTLFFLVHNVNQDANNYTSVSSNAKLETGKWYHIIAVWDTVHIALYINGSKDAENIPAGGVGQVKDSDGELVIGAQMNHAYDYYSPWGDLGFNGIIERVLILNRPLSDSEANDHYLRFAGTAGPGFTAYLLLAAKHNVLYIVVIFAVILLALAVIYFYNRKHVGAAS